MRPLIYFSLVFLFCFTACKEVDNTLLHGKWKAAQLIEQGKITDKSMDDTWFEFKPDGKYTYQTFSYKEAGPYHTMADVLYTTDTINTKAVEKAVRVIKVTADSLYFEMNDKGIDKELQLSRVK